ncbi:MAG: GDP-mannose 4,6-dehydratase [Candidatus Omnitrophica bacterium]|nr:GDP-mannose 4,6-dehydratase [Candidatus Omnitrophota bacterium]
MKKALIIGVTGQDGSYLAEFLLSKGYEVHGIIRRASTFNTERINHLYEDTHADGIKFFLHYGDLADGEQISSIIYNIKPDEIYHLGAQSHVRVSFDLAEYTGNITALGTTRILETIRRSNNNIKFYHAASSEMFGAALPPQNEETIFKPRSPYACAKVYGFWMTKNYREGYNMFASNGILFNHESPRRGETFVTRKITRAVAAILAKKQKHLYLGNLTAKRDWGYSPEYVEIIWEILQQDTGDDFVLGTGKASSVKEFMEQAFAYAGLDWKEYVKIDKRYFRPTEVESLISDTAKINEKLNWQPKIIFSDLVKIMIDADMRAVGLDPIGQGDEILKNKFPNRWWRTD